MNRFEFLETVRRNPFNRVVMERMPQLALPDCWLVSGSLFQTVWNTLTSRRPDLSIKDYDIFYFDPDTSYEAEDAVIRRAGEVFGDLGIMVEVRNQARVHLWYATKFGTPYPPLMRATDGIDRFLMHNAQVGIRDDGEIYAPHGFDDIFEMTIRPNHTANFHSDLYRQKAERWKAIWPRLTILPA